MKKFFFPGIVSAMALVFCLCFSLSVHNGSDNFIYNVPEQTDDGWTTATLSETGMDRSRIARLLNDLRNVYPDHYLQGIVIIKNEKLVFEKYFPGSQVPVEGFASGNLVPQDHDFNRETLHLLASASKSITSLLVGIAKDKGLINSLDEQLYSFFTEYPHLHSAEKDLITIGHALAMASGLPWNESAPPDDPRNNFVGMYTHPDPIGYILGLSPVAPPGTIFIYNSGTTNLLGEIVRKSSGQLLKEFARDNLFAPLQISSYEWVGFIRAPDIAIASGALYLRPRDMAKIGQLYLQEGMWKGNRIVSAEWIEESVEEAMPLTPSANLFPTVTWGYGYQWWLGTYSFGNVDAFIAAGHGGQFIIVLPDVDMVVVLTGGNWGYGSLNFQIETIVNNYILPAVIQDQQSPDFKSKKKREPQS